jgi:hypothetical protein
MEKEQTKLNQIWLRNAASSTLTGLPPTTVVPLECKIPTTFFDGPTGQM